MSKRKNPCQENESPTKKRKLDAASCSNSNWCIKLTSTQNATGEEQQFSINNKKSFKVGRDPSCCCVIFANTPMVSRVHCQFIYNTNNNQLSIKDLKSTNGVLVNGKKIDKNGSLTQLFNNDIIGFGKKYKDFNHEYKVEIIHNKYNNPSTSSNNTNNCNVNNILSIEAMLKRTVEAQLAAHSKQMDQKLAAKDAETKRLKQCLLEKEMKELAEKTEQQTQALETKRKEVENMRKEMENQELECAEKLKQEKLKIHKEKENAIKEARIKQDVELKKLKVEQQQKAQQQQMETQQKLEAIKAAQEKLEFEKKKQENEMKSHRQRMDVEEAKIKQKEIALKEQEEKVEELNKNINADDIEEETTCCMCYDILLKAHSLECGHTMCHQCILEWIDANKPNAVCPICRAMVKNDPTPCRVLDNIIEQYFKNKPLEAKNEYSERINEYKTWKTAYEAKTSNNNNNNVWGGGGAVGAFNWAAWGHNNNNNNAVPAVPVVAVAVQEEEEDSDWQQNISYSVERARSGRSTCRGQGCLTRIENQALRFGVHAVADPEHGYHYDTTHWYHPKCFGEKYKNNPEARQRRNYNIASNARLSVRALDDKLTEIFESDAESSSDSDSESDSDSDEESSSESEEKMPDRNRRVNNNNNDVVGGRKMSVDGINYRARVNRLENLTVYQLKRYCQENRINVASSMRKAALCAFIRRDITTHLRR